MKKLSLLLAIAIIAAVSLAAHAGKIVTTNSGLKYEDLKIGTGATAIPGNKVSVHYTGWAR